MKNNKRRDNDFNIGVGKGNIKKWRFGQEAKKLGEVKAYVLILVGNGPTYQLESSRIFLIGKKSRLRMLTIGGTMSCRKRQQLGSYRFKKECGHVVRGQNKVFFKNRCGLTKHLND